MSEYLLLLLLLMMIFTIYIYISKVAKEQNQLYLGFVFSVSSFKEKKNIYLLNFR